MNPTSIVTAATLAIILAGCASGPRSFPNTLPKNMQVTTTVDGGKVEAAVIFDVHRLTNKCDTVHEGRINLENGSLAVGLPVDQPLYLDFVFVSRAGFGSTVGATRHGTMFTPRTGHDYRAHVSYKRGIYAVEIREVRKGSSASRVVERVPLAACKRRV